MKNQHDRGRRDGQFILYTPSEVENELPFQLSGVGVDFFQYPIDRPFGFPVYQWIQTVSGVGQATVQGATCRAEPGSGILLYPDQAHRYQAIEEPWYVNWISFSGTQIARMLQYIGMESSGCYAISDDSVLSARIHKALSILGSDNPLRGIDGSAIVYQLLLDFLKYIQPDGAASRHSHIQRLKPAVDLIERELHRPLTLAELAAAIGVTPQYFCELFKSLTHHRPMEYVNQRRVDRAKEILLSNQDATVHQVARRVGFESDSYFSTVFRRYEGVSPRTFRQTNTHQGAAASDSQPLHA